MGRSSRRVALALALGAAAAAGVLLLPPEFSLFTPPVATATPGSAAQTLTVPIYFLARDGSGLSAEPRVIPHGGDLAQGVRAALRELLRGPQEPQLMSALPAGTRLRDVYLDRRKHAYCDFSRELRDNHPGGSWAEQMTVFSIVNTLVTDFPSVRKVQILIEGEATETLRGHLDLGRGLSKRLVLISRLSGQ